jgi:hypothetical protein
MSKTQLKKWSKKENDHELFRFLTEITEMDTLYRIRLEIEGKDQPSKNTEKQGDDEEDDDMVDDLEDEEADRRKELRLAAKEKRQDSKTHRSILEKYWECQPKNTDWTCFLEFLEYHIDELDYGVSIDALERLQMWLEKIQRLCEHANRWSSKSFKNRFSQITGIAKQYWIGVKGQVLETSANIQLWRKIVKAPMEAALMAEKAKRETLGLKLSHKFVEDFEHIQMVAYDWMHSYKQDPTDENAVKLMLAVQISCGARKTGVIDPSIEYYSWAGWRIKAQDEFGIDIDKETFRFGDDTSEIEATTNLVLETFKEDRIIIQYGVLKDSSQLGNKFLNNDNQDERWVENRVLRKPSILFTSREIIDAVDTFRKHFGWTKKSFISRKIEGSKIGTKLIRPIMAKAFSKSFKHAKAFGWSVSSHHCRKIYSQAAAKIYESQLRKVTSQYIDKSVFVSKLLGHQGSFQTAMSYANVEIEFPLDKQIVETPPLHRLRLFDGKLKDLEKRLTEFERQSVSLTQELKRQPETIVLGPNVEFMNTDMKKIALNKVRRTNYKDNEHRNQAVSDVVRLLTDNKILITYHSISKMGIGRNTYSAYLRSHGNTKRKRDEPQVVPIKKPKPIVVQNSIVEPKYKKDLETKYPGYKVIVADNKSDANKKITMQRDGLKFGPENVIHQSDCTGLENRIYDVKFDKKLIRDLCK